MQIQETLESTKVAAGVAMSTATVGVGDWFGWIPDDIGKFAALVGCVLTSVLIVSHARKLYKDWNKHD